jgi:hypothetical protein
LQSVSGAFLTRIQVLELSGEEVTQDRDSAHNAGYRLLARQAQHRNLFAQSLRETLTQMCTSLQKAVKLSADSTSAQGFQIYDPVALSSLVLNTLQMDSQQLIRSFKLAPVGSSQTFGLQPLEETALVRELNELLNTIEHDPLARHAGFTQLMVALVAVRVEYPDILKSAPEHFDDLLDQLVPYVDITTAMERLPETVKPVMEDFIMRRHQEFRGLVSLQGMGRAFSADLGI